MTISRLLCLILALTGCDASDDDNGDDGEDGGQAEDGGGANGLYSYRAYILAMDGTECSSDCPADVLLQVCGEMTNNTTEELLLTTPSTCLVEEWVVSGPTGSESLRWDCTDGEYDRYFQPEQSQAFCYSGWTGPAGSYTVTANFADGESISADFTLQ